MTVCIPAHPLPPQHDRITAVQRPNKGEQNGCLNSMHALVSAILAWAKNSHLEHLSALESQTGSLVVSNTYYTQGVGCFVSLSPIEAVVPFSALFLSRFSSLEGPTISSHELEAGAASILHIDASGLINEIEIWSHAGDYPIGRHPTDFSLATDVSNSPHGDQV